MKTFDMLSQSKRNQQQSAIIYEKYGIKGKPVSKPIGGGWKAGNSCNFNESSMSFSSSTHEHSTGISSASQSRFFTRNTSQTKKSGASAGIFGNQHLASVMSGGGRPHTSNEEKRPGSAISYLRDKGANSRLDIQSQKKLLHINSNIIHEDFHENYDKCPTSTVSQQNMVSNKFLRFLTEKGIPVTDTQTGQAVVVLEQKDQPQSQNMSSSSKVLRNSHLQDVMMAANQ